MERIIDDQPFILSVSLSRLVVMATNDDEKRIGGREEKREIFMTGTTRQGRSNSYLCGRLIVIRDTAEDDDIGIDHVCFLTEKSNSFHFLPIHTLSTL